MLIEDYGIIGDIHTAALVSRDGSIDWLCLPRFDSPACFAKLLGDESNGYWRIAPAEKAGEVREIRRRYWDDTLVLETEFETASGVVRLVDCMPIREYHPQVIRIVMGVRGTVEMRMDLVIRFDYGSIVPWVHSTGRLLSAVAGPDAVSLWGTVDTRGEDMTTVAEFTVTEGQKENFELAWYPSHEEAPRPSNAPFAVEDTEMYWRDWAAACSFEGEWRDAVVRSLITLKALTYQPTGGIVAAATTSLPETLGGGRNWDYRYCWLRDATLTLESLMRGGYYDEAMAWSNWLLRAAAGDPADLQIMYGPAGERRLEEWEVAWLDGYEGSKPVRVGNAAAGQYQLDVYGEVMSALYEASAVGNARNDVAWALQLQLMKFVEKGWTEPDDGIWEVRGPKRHFTHSKVMAWVAVDRAVRMVEEFGNKGPVDRWKQLRDQIHEEVCSKGYNQDVGAFTQYYGSDALDASLLMMPLVGFLPATDDRVRSTIEAIERDLTEDGFVLRYRAADAHDVDGLQGREGAFLACSFWMADCLYLLGREDDAHELFDRLVGLRNDLGLLAEEYDATARRQVGNFPQAFSHVSLVNAAFNLSGLPPIRAMDEEERAELARPRVASSWKRQWRLTGHSTRHGRHVYLGRPKK
ncbi:MAG TPA: glycoside hydrolase family 15 protein [Acidimicrobiales bacterium]|nr:glycoside hydrolase family 15 protein [Acidimicrobiales bacterium]